MEGSATPMLRRDVMALVRCGLGEGHGGGAWRMSQCPNVRMERGGVADTGTKGP